MSDSIPTVVAIAGLDPTGGAGLAADVRAGSSADIFVRTVATCLTVQDSRGVRRVEPVEVDTLRDQLEAAFADGADAIKIGLVPTAALIDALVASLPQGLPVVIDPVLSSTSGQPLVDTEDPPALIRLMQRATIATPNAMEARALSGEADLERAAWALKKVGAKNVLVKGGDEPGEEVTDLLLAEDGERTSIARPRLAIGPTRGTGCTLAMLIAAHVAQGYAVETAIRAAIEETTALLPSRVEQPGASILRPLPSSLLPDARAHAPEARERLAAVASAWRRLLPQLQRQDVPEVGANLSFLPATGDATGAAALSARCVRAGRGITIAGRAEIGGVHHTARIAAAAHAHDTEVRAAMNLRYRPEIISAARAAGLRVVSFRRSDQPREAKSSVEWGTDAAIRAHESMPDVLYDEGGPGKEPMIRILGRDPMHVVATTERLLLERS